MTWRCPSKNRGETLSVIENARGISFQWSFRKTKGVAASDYVIPTWESKNLWLSIYALPNSEPRGNQASRKETDFHHFSSSSLSFRGLCNLTELACSGFRLAWRSRQGGFFTAARGAGEGATGMKGERWGCHRLTGGRTKSTLSAAGILIDLLFPQEFLGQIRGKMWGCLKFYRKWGFIEVWGVLSLWNFCLGFPWGQSWSIRCLCVSYEKMTPCPWPHTLGSPRLGLMSGQRDWPPTCPLGWAWGQNTPVQLPYLHPQSCVPYSLICRKSSIWKVGAAENLMTWQGSTKYLMRVHLKYQFVFPLDK